LKLRFGIKEIALKLTIGIWKIESMNPLNISNKNLSSYSPDVRELTISSTKITRFRA